MNYLFYDTETTGKLPKYWSYEQDLAEIPRIVQIAFAAYNNQELIFSYSFIIRPVGFTIPLEATEIHGITTKMAQNEGMDLDFVLKTFEQWAGWANAFVCHNVQFDRPIVEAEFLRLKYAQDTVLDKVHYCTMLQGTDVCKLDAGGKRRGYKWPKLQELHLKLFGCGFSGAHNARVDVEATANCFFEMKKQGIKGFKT
jgi:DNA polymerase III subunit epsilon